MKRPGCHEQSNGDGGEEKLIATIAHEASIEPGRHERSELKINTLRKNCKIFVNNKTLTLIDETDDNFELSNTASQLPKS
jgi:hypothetical protein